MGWFDRLLKPQQELKHIGLLSGVPLPSVGLPSTDDLALVGAFNRNELVYACIHIKAQAAKDPALLVEQRDSEGLWREASGHPMKALWMRPNPYMTGSDFLAAALTSWEVARKFYAEIVRSAAGNPVELHPLDPSKVRKIERRNADGSKTLERYEWRDGIYRKTIAIEDMLVREQWGVGSNPSPLAVAMGAVDMDNAQTEYVRAFFANAGVPSGVINVQGVIDQTQSQVIQDNWRAKYGRTWGNFHNVAVFDERASYQAIGSNLQDLDSSTLRSISESRICMVFEVPPLIVYAYVGLLRSTYSNLKEAWAQFWDSTMSPVLRDWRDWLTWKLLSEFVEEDQIRGERVRLSWDFSNVAALQDDVDALHKRWVSAFRVGLLSVNEARARLGLPDVSADEPETVGERMPYLERILLESAKEERIAEAQEVAIEIPKRLPAPRQVKQRREEREQLDAYEEELDALMRLALDGDIEQEEFERRWKEAAAAALLLLFLRGAGRDPDSPLNAEERSRLNEQIRLANSSAEDLAADVYGGRYGGVHRDEDEDGEALDPSNRLALWVGAASGVLVLGRMFQDGDPMLEWRRGNTANPCDDCIDLDGRTMRASEWREYPLKPQSSALACHGINCQCDLYEV